MQRENTEKILTVLKKTHRSSAEPELTAVWRNSVMAEVHASGFVRPIPLLEKIAPRIVLVTTVLLVVLSVPAVLSVGNLMRLLDAELVNAAADASQFWMIL